jgi:hypothetical protein
VKYRKTLAILAMSAFILLEYSYPGTADPVINGGVDYKTASPEVRKQIEETLKHLKEVEAFKISEFKRTQDAIKSLLMEGKDTSFQEQYLKRLLELSASFPAKLVAQTAIAYPDNDYRLMGWIKELNGIELEPGKAFSLLAAFKERQLQTNSPDALGALATGIYAALLKTNFIILERSTSRTLPPYATLGIEAKVLPDGPDLLIKNPNDSSYRIYLEWYDGVIYTFITGKEFDNSYRIVKEDSREIAPRTIGQFGAIGTSEGKPGFYAKIYREMFNANNEAVKKEWISDDYSAPVHRVEQVQ